MGDSPEDSPLRTHGELCLCRPSNAVKHRLSGADERAKELEGAAIPSSQLSICVPEKLWTSWGGGLLSVVWCNRSLRRWLASRSLHVSLVTYGSG